MRPDGYIYLADLLACKNLKKMKVTEAVVEHIVANNDKKRFELSSEQGVKLIRAAQGHSIKIVESDALMQKITNPFEFNQIIHGTYKQPLPLIM